MFVLFIILWSKLHIISISLLTYYITNRVLNFHWDNFLGNDKLQEVQLYRFTMLKEKKSCPLAFLRMVLYWRMGDACSLIFQEPPQIAFGLEPGGEAINASWFSMSEREALFSMRRLLRDRIEGRSPIVRSGGRDWFRPQICQSQLFLDQDLHPVAKLNLIL